MFKLSELEVIINTTIMKYNTGSEYNVHIVIHIIIDLKIKRIVYYNSRPLTAPSIKINLPPTFTSTCHQYRIRTQHSSQST